MRTPRFSVALASIVAFAAAAGAQRRARDADIRAVDWCNLSFGAPLPSLSGCRETYGVRHRAGEGIHSFRRSRLGPVAYGDLTGDGREDAVVAIIAEHRPVLIGRGPIRVSVSLLLAEMRGRQVYVLDTGSIEGEVLRTSVSGSVASVVRRTARGECTERWRWSNGSFLADSPGC